MVLVGRAGRRRRESRMLCPRNGDASRGSGDRFSDERRSRGGLPSPDPNRSTDPGQDTKGQFQRESDPPGSEDLTSMSVSRRVSILRGWDLWEDPIAISGSRGFVHPVFL